MPDPDGAARIAAVEPLGGSTVLTLTLGGTVLRALLRGQPAVEPGAAVTVAAPPARVHYFDAGGLRLAG
jgi:multiple sugar transport system ATP-binding protein